MDLLRSILLLCIPGAVFSAALSLQLRPPLPVALQGFWAVFPSLAVAAGLFLGWRFNRSRVLWVIALLVVVERGLALAPPAGHAYLLAIAPLWIPVNLVLFNWWSERGLFTRHGGLRLLILLLQCAVLSGLFMAWGDDVMALLKQPILSNAWLETLPFSQTALIVMFLCQALLLIRFCQRPESLEGGFCWVLPAVLAGLWWPESFPLWGGVAVFILAVVVVESSFKMAFNDELTGLPARRAMNEFLLKVGRRYTLAMVDVDHFKKVNDLCGHDVGDQVLRMVATCLRRVTGGGRAYRYGGEEFAVIFPGKDLDRALPHLEALRETIARTGFIVRGRKRPRKKPEGKGPGAAGKKQLQVTVSIGVACRDESKNTPQKLIKAADRALYKAKKGGRNRVCSA